MVRKNMWKGRRDCTIYADYCSSPRGFRGNVHYESMSLFPPTPAVFVKHHGEFVGGLVNQKWNKLSKCGDRMDACSFDYDDKKAAKVLSVHPQFASPGDKITVVGKFFKRDNVHNPW